MLSSGALEKLWATRDPKSFLLADLGSRSQVNTKGSTLHFLNFLEGHYVHNLHTLPSLSYYPSKQRSHQLWTAFKHDTARSLLCHLHISASSDEDYRSSRNIAISLFKRYRNVVDRGGGDNLKEFISAGVNSYALGCTAEDLRKELVNMKNSGTEIEGLEAYGGGTSFRFKILSEEVQQSWFPFSACSFRQLLSSRVFPSLSVLYFQLPVKTLQLEQMAVMGNAEEPSVVASRMRLVFSTLEVVSPQWPRV